LPGIQLKRKLTLPVKLEITVSHKQL